MISFTFTPAGSSASTTLTLLDSDRFWPPEMAISAGGEAQVSNPVRGGLATYFGRGLRRFDLRFSAQRQHANLFAAVKYALETVPSMLGARGTLTIAMPFGGSLRAVNCVCVAANARYGGIRTYCDFSFAGPSIGP